MLAQGVEQYGGEAEIAFHELFLVLGAVHAGKVEDEVAVTAPLVKLLGRGVNVILIDFFNLHVNGQQSMVNSQWSTVNGQQSTVFGEVLNQTENST